MDNYIEAYKELTNKLFPYSSLDYTHRIVRETISSLFKVAEIIDIYVNNTSILDSWNKLKMNEMKNQLLMSLYYLPNFTPYVFNSFQRSIVELVLKITLYSASAEPKTVDYQNKVNRIQYRLLSEGIKELEEYSNSSKVLLDTFFSIYGNSSNEIHLKDSSSLIENIETYNSIKISEIKQFQKCIMKVEIFLLTIYPTIHNLNDHQLTLSAKHQLKKILSEKKYNKYFT